jgi:uncharacterized protein
MKKILLITFLNLIIYNSVFSQSENKLTIVSPDKQRIEVIGTAEKIVEPDIIYVSITLKEKVKDGLKISVESLEEKLKSEIVLIGLNIESLTLTDANTETIRITKKSKKIITTKTYNLKLITVADVRKTFIILDKMDITDASITGTDVSNRIEILKSTRIEAIKVAKKKAEYLLEAIGQEIDKPIVIRELQERSFDYSSSLNSNNIGFLNSTFNQLNTSGQTKINDLKIEKITITARIYIEYGIK